MMTRHAIPIVLTYLLFAPAVSRAQDEEPPQLDEVDRMVRDGMAEALDRRLGGGRTAGDVHMLAQAYRNRARKIRDSADRKKGYAEAAQRYVKWIEMLESSTGGDPANQTVDRADARFEYAGMILSQWIAGALDQFEITSGQRGDRGKLLALLKEARQQYEEALVGVEPLYEEINLREDEFLALGIFDQIRQLKLDCTISLGWTTYYIGVVTPDDKKASAAAQRVAEAMFQELVDSGQAGEAIMQCYLGLAMSMREQKRFDEADANFGIVVQDGSDTGLTAQARYESARSQISQQKFAEARATLGPLLEKDVENLRPEDKPAKFYIYLAMLWDANSRLIEAKSLRRTARNSAGRTAILRQAKRTRDRGLSKMNRLRALGGPWPAVVNLYQAMSIDLDADPAELDPGELLSLASELMRLKKHEQARDRLREAVSRTGVDKGVIGDVLFELGRCYYILKDERNAAKTFQTLASEHRGHDQASRGASFAYQLWAKLSKASKHKNDFNRLADTLLNLVQAFPEHPKRREAMWWLPVALQSAGKYKLASEQFGKVPEDSRHWEEARFRHVACARLECESLGGALAEDAYVTRVRSTALRLTDYADKALARANSAGDSKAVQHWAAEARVNAAELLVSHGANQFHQSLSTLKDFEARHPESALIGRALAARIRAHRGLKEYEQASKILDLYLQTVSPQKAGAVLSSLAKGMQEEVERLQEDDQIEAAKALAGEAVAIFQELEKWFLADEKRAAKAGTVQIGLARMLYIAGRLEEAEQIVNTLLQKNPKNGNLQRLRALTLTDRLTAGAPPERIDEAKKAWAVLLRDKGLRTRTPQRYWEARYHWLAMTLRQGNAADVEKAIRQDRVWFPEMGGAPWKDKLDALYAEVASRLGIEPGQDAP